MVDDGWNSSVEHHDKTYVGGRWVDAGGQELISVTDPSSGMRIATIRESSEENVAAAVLSASRALPALRSTSISERASMLVRLADELENRAEALTTAISREMGMPLKHCQSYQVQSAVTTCETQCRRSTPWSSPRRSGTP